jgi:general secretion pathway protein C
MALISTRGLSTKPLPSVVLIMGYLLAFCTLAACLAFWGMQLFAPPAPIASSGVVAEKTANLDLTGAGKLFGTTVTAQQAAATIAPPINVKIVGVMAVNQTARASAILSIENRPAQAFAIGDYLGNDTKLVDITSVGILIEQGGNRTKIATPPVPTIASLSKPVATASTQPVDKSLPRSSIALPAGGGTASGSVPFTPAPQPAPFVQPNSAQPNAAQPNAAQPNATQPITPPQMLPAAGIQGSPTNPNDGNGQPSTIGNGGAFGRPK